jgi:hypothetical protein
MCDRPEITQEATLISDLHLLLSENDNEVNDVLYSMTQQTPTTF